MAYLIEFYDREKREVVPRMQDGSVPLFLYRVMSRQEFDHGNAAKVFTSREGRIHASPHPQLQHCQPGEGNVLVKIHFESSDGWRAKQTGFDGVVAICERIPAKRVEKIAEGSRTQILAEMARLRIEAKVVKPAIRIAPKGRETGRNFQDGKYVLYQFGIELDRDEIAELAVKFTGGDKEAAKVNIFGNAKGRLGTSGMRAVFRLLKKRFPALKSIYGDRISGARAKAGHAGRAAHMKISAQVARYFKIMSKPEDDLKRVRQGRLLWAEVVKRIQRFMKNPLYKKQVLQHEYVSDVSGIGFQKISNPDTVFNPPYKKMRFDVFTVELSKLVGDGHAWDDLRVVINLTNVSADHGSGVFYSHGLWGIPTVVVNAYLNYNPAATLIPKDVMKKFVDDLPRQEALAKVFTHEFSHYLDNRRAVEKTPHVRDEKGNVVKWGGDRSKYTQPEENYKDYINHHKEINSRYMEWIDGIIKSFERQVRVKAMGVKGAFPTFHKFWEYYWKESGFAPDGLRMNATPQTTRRLARRLSKFYEYVTETGDRPAPEEMKKFAVRQLQDDPKFVERDRSFDYLNLAFERRPPAFIADFSAEVPAGLYNAFGPSVGGRPDEWSRNKAVEDEIFRPKAPKPNPKDAAAITTRKGMPPQFQKKNQPEDEDAEAPDDAAADEAEDAPPAKGKGKFGKGKSAPPKANKGPRPKMRELRANYRKAL